MTLTDITRRLTGARDAVRELHAADKALRQAHAQAEAERQHLLTAKAPRADVIAAMEAAVDAIAEDARGNLGPRLVAALSGGVDVEPSGHVTGLRPGNLAHAFSPGALTIGDFAVFAQEALKASLRAAIEGATYREGPPMAQRLALLAAVDKKIADLARQHAELVDEAAAAGIALGHLPDEHARRLRAMPADEREAAIALERARQRR